MSKSENKMPLSELKVTEDGSHTLYLPEIDEHYHSHFGAMTESEVIFINAGLKSCYCNPVRVLEVGFGTGLNALLSAIHAEKRNIHVCYVTLEKYPLPPDITDRLNYGSLIDPDCTLLYRKILEASWNTKVSISEYFTIEKRNTDVLSDHITGIYDLIYFDAFGPDKQPEMWSEEVFEKMDNASAEGSVFVTYSAKGSLKRILKSKGFEVSHLPGPPGKRCFTRAVKK